MTDVPTGEPGEEQRRELVAEGDRSPRSFDPRTLDKSLIAVPLLNKLEAVESGTATDEEPLAVIIDLNLDYHGDRDAARQRVHDLVETAVVTAAERQGRDPMPREGVDPSKRGINPQYVFARLSAAAVRELAQLSLTERTPDGVRVPGPIHRIWPDFPIHAQISRSISTVKADAARTAFSALGEDIVWAVLDSGIRRDHPHFKLHGNLKLQKPLHHKDFTGTGSPTEDDFGHGTHVAGIIAGELVETGGVRTIHRHHDDSGEDRFVVEALDKISGMAPTCKLLSLKVLDEAGNGMASNIIAALQYIQDLNNHGRRIRVHGVNISAGYPFDPEWFACGQSPVCVEVDRLARSGVVVVVAAGNTGYGWLSTSSRGAQAAGMGLTINDPGNAELAITVGSTHRDQPHVYGVSYFSSKGPTGDGRVKPDLLAPGERIMSCAAGKSLSLVQDQGMHGDYLEDSGTSMAAPHVSGAIAAFLSVRREFIGRPERVKDIFVSTATDLHRDRYFQGHGLVDLMRAIQSV